MVVRTRSLRRRLDRLEAKRKTQAGTYGRTAIVTTSLENISGEWHLVIVSESHGHFTFRSAVIVPGSLRLPSLASKLAQDRSNLP